MAALRNLDFRPAKYGGGGFDNPKITTATWTRRRRHILLMHGFNSSGVGAEASYDEFSGHIGERLRDFYYDAVYVFWPGDWGWPVSAAFYRADVKIATENADKVARWLGRFEGLDGGPCELVIIAHSLGCRVALEALTRLPPERRRMVTLILLAAAVPTELFRDPNMHANLGLKFSAVYFSGRDIALSLFFPWLETRLKYSGNLWRPEAVGGRGGPPATWHITRPTDLGHTAYWKSKKVAEHVASHLGSSWMRAEPFAREVLERIVPSRPDAEPRGLLARYQRSRAFAA